MSRPRAFQLMIGLALIMLLVGCRRNAPGPVSEASAPTSTLGPATAMPSPELPTATPTPIPIPPTLTPISPTETATLEAVQPQPPLSNSPIPGSETPAPTSTLGPATAMPSPELPTATPTPIPIPPTPTPMPPTETPMLEAVQPQLPTSNLGKIAFASDNIIYLVDVNTNELTKLAQVDEVLCCPRWSPDRQKIAFAIGWGMHYGVYEVGANGSNLERLTYIQRTDGEGPPLVPVWSQDGQQIDFVYGNTWPVDEDSSPDGQRIAFVVRKVENDEPVAELHVKNADGTNVTKLTTTPLRIWGIDW